MDERDALWHKYGYTPEAVEKLGKQLESENSFKAIPDKNFSYDPLTLVNNAALRKVDLLHMLLLNVAQAV